MPLGPLKILRYRRIDVTYEAEL